MSKQMRLERVLPMINSKNLCGKRKNLKALGFCCILLVAVFAQLSTTWLLRVSADVANYTTIGNTTMGASNQVIATSIFTVPVVVPYNMTLKSLTIGGNYRYVGDAVIGGIYTSNGSYPSTCLGTTNIAVLPASFGWTTLTFPSAGVVLTQGTYYFGVRSNQSIGGVYIRYTTSDVTGFSVAGSSTFPNLDATYPSDASVMVNKLSLYATGVIASGATIMLGSAPPSTGTWVINQNTMLQNQNLIINGSVSISTPYVDYWFNISDTTIIVNGGISAASAGNAKCHWHNVTWVMNGTNAVNLVSANLKSLEMYGVSFLKNNAHVISGQISANLGVFDGVYMEGVGAMDGFGVINGYANNIYFKEVYSYVRPISNARGYNWTVDSYYSNALQIRYVGVELEKVTIIKPNQTEYSALAGLCYLAVNNTYIKDVFVEGISMLSPHQAVSWGAYGGNSYNGNNTLVDLVVVGNAGNGLFRQYTYGVNYVVNATFVGVTDATDGDSVPAIADGVLSTIVVSDSRFIDSDDNFLSGDNSGGCGWDFVNCTVQSNYSYAGSYGMCVSSANSFIRTTNVTWLTIPPNSVHVGSVSSYVLQMWNFSEGISVRLRTNTTHNLNTLLMPASFVNNVLTFSVVPPSGVTTYVDVYSPLGVVFDLFGGEIFASEGNVTTISTTGGNATVYVSFSDYIEVGFWHTYLVQLESQETVVTQGDAVNVAITVTRDGVAFPHYFLNISKNEAVWRGGVVSSFSDVEASAVSNTYTVTGLFDVTLGAWVSFSASPVIVTWVSSSGGVGGGVVYYPTPSPTETPVAPTPTPVPSEQGFSFVFGLVVIVGVVAVAVAFVELRQENKKPKMGGSGGWFEWG